MGTDFETFGGQGFPGPMATGNIEHLAAVFTDKVVVMPDIGELISGGLPGELYQFEPPLFVETLEIAVDGSDANSRYFGVREFLNFIGSQGARRIG